MKKFLKSLLGEEQKPLLRMAGQSFVLRFVGLGLIYLSQIVLARLMGVRDFGTYTVIMTWLNIVVVFSLAGFDQSAQRFFSLYQSRQDAGRMRGYLRFSFRLILTVSFLCIVFLFWVLINRAKHFSLTYSEALFWSLFLIPVLAVINQCSALLRSVHKVRLSLIFIYLIIPLSVIATALLYYFYYGSLRYDAAVLLYLGCTLIVAWIISARVKKTFGAQYKSTEPIYANRLWLGASSVFLIMNLLTILMKQMDILMLSHYLDNTKAGIYSAAVRFSSLVSFGLIIVDYVFTPRISTLHANNNKREFQAFLSHAAKIILIITIPISIFLAIAGKFLLILYGDQFDVSYGPLLILIGGQVIYALVGMSGPLLTMTGHQNTFIIIYLLAVILDFLLNSILIPIWGPVGAAIATSSSAIVLSISMYLAVKQKLSLRASVL